MQISITEQEWRDLATSQKKGIKDSDGQVWVVLRACSSVAAHPNALRLLFGAEECTAIWNKNQICTDLDGMGLLPELCLNDLSVAIVDVP